jgi:hypothetical protein
MRVSSKVEGVLLGVRARRQAAAINENFATASPRSLEDYLKDYEYTKKINYNADGTMSVIYTFTDPETLGDVTIESYPGGFRICGYNNCVYSVPDVGSALKLLSSKVFDTDFDRQHDSVSEDTRLIRGVGEFGEVDSIVSLLFVEHTDVSQITGPEKKEYKNYFEKLIKEYTSLESFAEDLDYIIKVYNISVPYEYVLGRLYRAFYHLGVRLPGYKNEVVLFFSGFDENKNSNEAAVAKIVFLTSKPSFLNDKIRGQYKERFERVYAKYNGVKSLAQDLYIAYMATKNPDKNVTVDTFITRLKDIFSELGITG